MALTCPPMPGREYFQARSRIRPLLLFPSAGRQSWTSAMYRTQLEPLVHPGQPELSAQSPQGDRALNKKTSVTESFPRPYEPGSMSMALCLLVALPSTRSDQVFQKGLPSDLLPQLPHTGYFSSGSVSSMSPKMVRQYSAIFACCLGLGEIRQE